MTNIKLKNDFSLNEPTHARIEFFPICSNCKKVIWERVDYEKEIVPACMGKIDTKQIYYPRYSFEPTCCPHCHVRFESIIMPSSLPFDGY